MEKYAFAASTPEGFWSSAGRLWGYISESVNEEDFDYTFNSLFDYLDEKTVATVFEGFVAAADSEQIYEEVFKCIQYPVTSNDDLMQDVPDPNDVDNDGDGHTENEGDCDDTNNTIYPGATEIPYDGIDQDCDGTDLTDVDGDGYHATVAGGDDCNDNDATINPGITETCGDNIDNNCNGEIDEGCGCAINEILGDLDGDCAIDSADYTLFRNTLGKCSGDAAFIADADYDGDGCITYADYRIWYGYYRNQ